MSLLTKRDYYKPFAYPFAYEAYKKQNEMHWTPNEVSFREDVQDWQHSLTPAEKNLLTQLFRFFTQADVDVAKGYIHKFLPIFGGNPEVAMMMTSFAAMEAVHIDAYSTLLETVGMPEVEYQAFFKYKEMADKHEYLESHNKDRYLSDTDSMIKGIAKDLAVYSAFTEGLQLFSSFAILMNFPRFNKMKGMGQIIAWSIRDESLHVENMIKLFREFVAENYDIWTDDFKGEIYAICKKMVELEDAFIDLAFSQGGIEGLEAEDVKRYIRYIADRRLLQLGLKTNYGVKKNPLEWLDEMLNAVEHTNFFENRVTEYNKGTMKDNWDEVFA